MSKEFKSWDQYAQEAAIEPFRLPIGGDEILTFECPSGTALMRIAEGIRSGDSELILRSIAGDQWESIEELLNTAGHKAMVNLMEDMLDHFDLYEDVTLVGPGGGKVTARRPRRINTLINQGYRPVGEPRASRG